MTAARVPLNFFGMPFGLAGLGVTWLIGVIATWTLLAVGRRQPMPRPVPATRDPEFAGRSRS